MHTLFIDYLDRLQELHTDLRRAIEGLPQDALDWSPGPGMNSIAVLAAHTTGALRYWIGDVAGQDPSGRVRETEFHTKDLDAAALIARLDAAFAHSRTVLERLALSDLESKRLSPHDGRELTVAWALAHALAHTAIHAGHIQLTRQLWDQRR